MSQNFKPMLAKDADLTKIKFPLVAQPKLDGIRISIVDGKPLTRTLKDVPNAEVREYLSNPQFNGLDGEILVGDSNAEDVYRQTCSFVMAPSKTGADWCFHVFDMWDSPCGFMTRYGDLKDNIVPGLLDPRIKLVPAVMISNHDELSEYEAEVVAAGGEGIILRSPNAEYKFGRSGKTGPLLKVKRFEDFEATIIGVYEEMHNGNEKKVNELGRGQRSSAAAGKTGKGTLGGFICEGLTDYEGIEFRVGTGFDAAQRSEYWIHQALAPGKIAKIKAFPVGVKDKPRHPVFLGFRDLEAGA